MVKEQPLVPGCRWAERALLPGPQCTRGRATMDSTSSEGLPVHQTLPPCSSQLPPSPLPFIISRVPLFLPDCPNFFLNIGNLRSYCCAVGCSGQGRGDPRTKANSSQGTPVQGRQTLGDRAATPAWSLMVIQVLKPIWLVRGKHIWQTITFRC